MNTVKKSIRKTDNKKKVRLNWHRLISVLVIAILCVYAVWTLITQEIEIQKTKRELADLNAQLQEQNSLHDELEKQNKLVNTPEYMERAARDELGYAAPDEIIFKDASQE